MYRLLIVDDESNHRKGLGSLIQELYPECILLEAGDGTDAMEILELVNCDIMITDIRMANMDGLKLLKLAKELNPEIEVVILSGYGQFDYAIDALKYGAADYLMKPVDKQEIKEIFNKLMVKIEDRRREKQKHLSLELQLTETMPVYVEHLMNELIEKDDFPKKEQLSWLFPLEQAGYIMLCRIHGSTKQRLTEIEKSDIKYMIKKRLDPVSTFTFFHEQNLDMIVVFVLSEEKPHQHELLELSNAIKKGLGLSLSFCTGKIVDNLYNKARISFAQAFQIFPYMFYDTISVQNYDCMEEKINQHGEDFQYETGKILEFIKKNELLQAYKIFEESIVERLESVLLHPIILKQKITFSLLQIVRSFEFMMSQEFREDANQKIQQMQYADTFTQLKQSLRQFFIGMGKELQRQRDIKGSSILQHCVDYLEEHYMDEINLEVIAVKYYFNPSYFSTLFKNHFNKTFSEYLIELRMNKAKDLLLGSSKKVKEIAVLIGYRDANYFVRSFKRFYGMTPEEFRKMSSKE